MRLIQTFLVVLSAAVYSGFCHRMDFENKCSFTVWPGALSTHHAIPKQGGWEMGPGSTTSFSLSRGWSGRFWGRGGCNFNGAGQGSCETGDCGRGLRCNGAGGIVPATLAEFTFDGHEGLDFYDVSLVDGYNLPVAIYLTGSHEAPRGSFYCQPSTCPADLNRNCPSVLRKTANGRTVACLSACAKFNTDAVCCRGAHDRPETCKPSQELRNYVRYFKDACPLAYSFAYDDRTSTFTCKGANTGYKIVFCPDGGGPVTPPTTDKTCQKSNNMDVSGANLDSIHNQPESACCGLCARKSGCKAYAWNNYRGGTCWLKTSTTLFQKSGVKAGVVGGKPTGGGANCRKHNNRDVSGPVLAPIHGQPESACCGICKERSGCRAYAWNDYRGGTCWLKTSTDLFEKGEVKAGVLN